MAVVVTGCQKNGGTFFLNHEAKPGTLIRSSPAAAGHVAADDDRTLARLDDDHLQDLGEDVRDRRRALHSTHASRAFPETATKVAYPAPDGAESSTWIQRPMTLRLSAVGRPG